MFSPSSVRFFQPANLPIQRSLPGLLKLLFCNGHGAKIPDSEFIHFRCKLTVNKDELFFILLRICVPPMTEILP